MYSTKLAIVKCQAYKQSNDFIRGNNVSDEVAKKASKCTIPILTDPMVIIESTPQPDDIIRIQKQAGPYEQSMWHQRGANKDGKGLWRSHEGIIIAPTMLLNLLIPDAHGFDHCAREGRDRSDKKN